MNFDSFWGQPCEIQENSDLTQHLTIWLKIWGSPDLGPVECHAIHGRLSADFVKDFNLQKSIKNHWKTLWSIYKGSMKAVGLPGDGPGMAGDGPGTAGDRPGTIAPP